jgi:hypothetical protein
MLAMDWLGMNCSLSMGITFTERKTIPLALESTTSCVLAKRVTISNPAKKIDFLREVEWRQKIL